MNLTGYDVGALLYCPANAHRGIAEALIGERIPQPFSLSFCLEDTVLEGALAEAEDSLERTLTRIAQAQREAEFYLPPIFIRVRTPRHLEHVIERYGSFFPLLTGFILPKFFIDNCGAYVQVIRGAGGKFCYMPILESPAMVELESRHAGLARVQESLEPVSERILNIRVGASDLSNVFGLRRRVDTTIYELRPVANLLCDIVTAFARRYVVSGPVWEYYAGPGWAEGLRRETEQDLLSGFIGKTVIHPSQIPVVNRCLQVSQSDYADARAILDWDPARPQLVSSSAGSTRMNEYNTHLRWAQRTVRLAQRYGLREGAV